MSAVPALRPAMAFVGTFALMMAVGCGEASTPACRAPEVSSATCEEACANLAHLDCLITATAAECVTTCATAGAGLDPAVRDRVQACYALATTCGEVDDCSLGCGPGGGTVPFLGLDAGVAPIDAGAAVDAGPDDAGSDDAGGDDAGAADTDAAAADAGA